MDEQDYEEMWNAAQEYNEKLFETGHGLGLKKKEKKEYNKVSFRLPSVTSKEAPFQ